METFHSSVPLMRHIYSKILHACMHLKPIELKCIYLAMFRKETNKLKMTIYYILYILSSSLSRNGTIVKCNYKLLAFSHFTAISMQNKKSKRIHKDEQTNF